MAVAATPATVVAGITGPIWGCTDEAFLYVNSMQLNPQREKAELKNGQSQFVQSVWHSPKRTLSASGKVRVVADIPGKALIGHIVTVTDTQFAGEWFVDDVTQGKTEGDWMEVSYEMTEYETATTGAWTTTTTA